MLTDKNGKPLSRSEGEALMKSRSSITVSIFAALLAICALLSAGNSSKVLNNTIAVNDVYAFYQAKSIKQSIAQQELSQLQLRLTEVGANISADARQAYQRQIADLEANIVRYESDPATQEGKKELLAQAARLNAERNVAKSKGPWYGLASAALQIAIVLSSTSILGVSMLLLWGSVGFGIMGGLFLINGYFFMIPWPF